MGLFDPMAADDIYEQVAALHAASIGQGFLATLGVPFLSLMYQAIDEAEDSVLLVEEREGRVVGFVSAGVGMSLIYRQMLKRPIALGFSLFPCLVKPSRISRIIDILRYGRGEFDSSSLPKAELLSIAIAPDVRGSGVADRLYRRLVTYFIERDVTAFKITVGDVLVPAHRFYLRMGAKPVGSAEVHAGASSTIYIHKV